MRIIPSITLNVDGVYFPSGIPVEVDDDIAENAISLGIASRAPDEPEAATIDAPEESVAPDEPEDATINAPETATTTRAKRKR